MGSILSGSSLSKVRPFGSGFLILSNYGRVAVRLSALMEIVVIFIFTHDSIGVGEDGPTHQPAEHLASLCGIPGLVTLRPCDANEAVEAYRYVMHLPMSAACWCCRAKLCPPSTAASTRHQAWRLRAQRRPGRKSRGDPYCLRE